MHAPSWSTVFALACACNSKRTTTVSGLEQRSRAANHLLTVQFPQQCVGRPHSDGFKSSPSKKSTSVQTCTLLQPPLHLNYNLLLLTDASLPVPRWIAECFYEFCWTGKVWQYGLQLHKTSKYLKHFWEKAKTQVEGRWAAGDFLLCSMTWICKVLHRCSVSVRRGHFRALSHVLSLKGGHLCTT